MPDPIILAVKRRVEELGELGPEQVRAFLEGVIRVLNQSEDDETIIA